MFSIETEVRKSIKIRWTSGGIICSFPPDEEVYYPYFGEEDGTAEEFKRHCIDNFIQKLKRSQAWNLIEDALFQKEQGWI